VLVADSSSEVPVPVPGEDDDDLRCILLFCCLQILTLFQMQKTHTEQMHQRPVAEEAVVRAAVVVQVHPGSVHPVPVVPVTLTPVPAHLPAHRLTAVTRNQVRRSCPTACVSPPSVTQTTET
jgi:hypothetical protein